MFIYLASYIHTSDMVIQTRFPQSEKNIRGNFRTIIPSLDNHRYLSLNEISMEGIL